MDWIESGRAWGDRAADWAYLMEPYARSANDALFDRANAGPVKQRIVGAPRIRLHQIRPIGGPVTPGPARFDPVHRRSPPLPSCVVSCSP